MKVYKKLICRSLRSIEKRPWLFAALYLASLVIAAVPRAILFGNVCDSKLRFLPELSDEMVLVLNYRIAYNLDLGVLLTFALLFLSPVALWCFRRSGIGLKILGWNLVGFFAGILLVIVNFFFGLQADEQMRVARINLAAKAKAEKMGLKDYDRISAGRFRQHCWSYGGDGRYRVWQSANDAQYYWLVDEKWRPMEGTNGRLWEDKVLLEDVAKWSEVDGVLYLLTRTGRRHVLDYKNGEAYEYPNAQHCPQSSRSDEVFENLERRLKL